MLTGLSISIQTAGKICELCSVEHPVSDSPGSFRGTTWPRLLVPLPFGISLEQQMLLPAAGNAIAISWRLIGQAICPVLLKVTPIFQAPPPNSAAAFYLESEKGDDRLAWRPYHHFSRIIADTNGRFVPIRRGPAPDCFEFALGPCPALLILATEIHDGMTDDPLIGAFLAHLAEQRAHMPDSSPGQTLIAA